MRKRAELQAHGSQYNLQEPFGRIRRQNHREGLENKFTNPNVSKSILADMQMLDAYDGVIASMEYEIQKIATHHDPVAYALLRSLPEIGEILGLVILYEIGDIKRFPKVQDFTSYCRLVKSARESNGKMYGSSGKKIGNAHLKWAFSEVAKLFTR